MNPRGTCCAAARPRLLRLALGMAGLLAVAGLTGLAGGTAEAEARASSQERFRVLVYSRTEGFRHASIPVAVATVRELGQEHRFGVVATEDPAAFARKRLRRFDAVIFLLTTGDVLAPRQQRNLRWFVRRGGGYVGVHSASDTEHDWPYYGKLVGAYFKSHPIQQLGEIVREAARHPATRHLPERFTVFDEFYSFDRNPRPQVRVLLTIDEDSYMPDPNTTHLPGGTPSTGYMGDHPMSWCHDRFRGRAFYTALGHEPQIYLEDWFRRHLLGGILVAARQVRAGCRPRAGGGLG